MKLAEAINAAYRCEQRVKRGLRPMHASDVTLAVAFDTIYLHSVHRESTRKTQLSRFDAHVRYVIGNRPLHLITTSELVKLLRELAPSRKCRRAITRLKPSTYNRVVDLLKAIFRTFFEQGLVEGNVAQGLQKHSERNQRVRILREDEQARFFAALGAAPLMTRLLISLLVLTGMRLGEALSARWIYVDLGNRVIRLPDSKSGRPRVIPLSDEACAICRQLQDIRKNEFLFPGRGDGSMSRPSRHFKALLAEAGVEGLWIHDLRRTFATRIAAVLPTHAVSAILGHSSVAVTERYLVTTDLRLHDAANSIGRQFSPLLSGTVSEEGALSQLSAAGSVDAS